MARLTVASAVVVASIMVGATLTAPAQAAPSRASVKVIAKGLNNPRGIITGPDGTLLVAEAGKGGKGKCVNGPEGRVCLGRTGSITRLQPSSGTWKSKRIITRLPSLAAPSGEGALGPHDLAYRGHTLTGTIGLGGSPSLRKMLGQDGKLLGHVVEYRPTSKIADLARFEERRNPDFKDAGSSVDSNPYGLMSNRGGLVVTDAGGNTLLAVDKRGKVSTLAVFHSRQVAGPGGAGKVWMQAVPTTVVRGPDGAYYISQLTGFPFPPGGASVWRFKPGHKPTVYARGFTNIVDIAFDRRGHLLVLEITKFGLLSNNPTGALIRLDSKKKRTEIAPGKLTMPGGVAVGRNGVLYVTNKSVAPGGGEVLRIKL